MAAVKPAKSRRDPADAPETTLTIGLHDPGMTPLLRAGLGGLAAAVEAMAPSALGEDAIIVASDCVTLDWTRSGNVGDLLERLFAAAFRIDGNGLIDLPGSYRAPEQAIAVRASVTDALRRTFLQHGSSAKKDGKPTALTIEIDDQAQTIGVQRHASFVHQGEWQEIAKQLAKPAPKRAAIALAGWANPGAATRHVAYSAQTEVGYSAAQALCACFTITGCLSFCGPGQTGILVVPEPADLEGFAALRGELAPRRRIECFVGSAGDGALAMAVALRAVAISNRTKVIAQIHAILLSPLAWVAGGQKVRIDTLACAPFEKRDLDAFSELTSHCPPRQIVTKPAKKADLPGCWTIPSNLRGFVANNLAHGRSWFVGFAHCKTRDNPPRWLHRFWRKGDDDLGALRFPDDLKGLIAMSQSLDEAERTLVASIHTALRQRFGAIADENQGNPAAFKNRCQGERDKWRLRLAGAKTPDDVRAALADLWSRAGTVRELQEGWQRLLPLLKPAVWENARDLALIALASYRGKGASDVSESDHTTTH